MDTDADGYENNFDFSDDNEERMSESRKELFLVCKSCGGDYSVGAKGSSQLKELCAKCHAEEIEKLLGFIAEDSDIAQEDIEAVSTTPLSKVRTGVL